MAHRYFCWNVRMSSDKLPCSPWDWVPRWKSFRSSTPYANSPITATTITWPTAATSTMSTTSRWWADKETTLSRLMFFTLSLSLEHPHTLSLSLSWAPTHTLSLSREFFFATISYYLTYIYIYVCVGVGG